MEERKRRIMRKYLRERTDITYSDEVVPLAGSEDDDDALLDSEKFKAPEVNLDREEPSRMPPPVWRPAPRTESRNWLLSEDEEQNNPFADPFAPKESDEPQENNGSFWESEPDSFFYDGTQRGGRYGEGEYDPYSGEQSKSYYLFRQGGMFAPGTSFGSDAQSDFQPQRGRPASPWENMYAPDEKSLNPAFNSGWTENPYQRTIEAPNVRVFRAEDQADFGGYTPYKSPYQLQREQQQEQRGGYTPYKSPYQLQREQRQEQRRGYTPPKQEYQRQDPLQQWKKRNATQFDPTGNDAFIQETMPKNRR